MSDFISTTMVEENDQFDLKEGEFLICKRIDLQYKKVNHDPQESCKTCNREESFKLDFSANPWIKGRYSNEIPAINEYSRFPR